MTTRTKGSSEPNRRPPTVLCIDDDPDIAETIGARLDPYDVRLLRAFHGMQGFWLAMTERPDLIITDIRMPQGTGDYIVECLKSNSDTRHIPVIVLSGQRDATTIRKLQKLGVADYLTKPAMFDDLKTTIEKYMELPPCAQPAATASGA